MQKPQWSIKIFDWLLAISFYSQTWRCECDCDGIEWIVGTAWDSFEENIWGKNEPFAAEIKRQKHYSKSDSIKPWRIIWKTKYDCEGFVLQPHWNEQAKSIQLKEVILN